MKRTAIKKQTREGRILRYMRTLRHLSMTKAGAKCNLAAPTINHYEKGRLDLNPERIEKLLKAYQFTRAEFDEYMNGKEIPALSLKEECISLLDQIGERRLRAVHGVLLGFVD